MKSQVLSTTILSLSSLIILPLVAGHGFISYWSADGQKFEKAQKQPLSDTAFRGAPTNTGWIGSKFINTDAIVCGAAETPKGTVAPPTGTLFSKPEQSAKKTLKVKAGGKVEMIVSGDPGHGFPHQSGHIQAFLGQCGTSETACQNFDAAKTDYQKIQAEVDAIPNKLLHQFDSKLDGNKWQVPIPANTARGSYILRLELISFGQSAKEEGNQDQYYVFCGQIFVDGTKSSPNVLITVPTVTFPGAYKPGNIDPHSLPGPSEASLASTQDDGKSETNKSVPVPASDRVAAQDTTDFNTRSEDSQSQSTTETETATEADSDSDAGDNPVQTASTSPDPPAPKCADSCYKKTVAKLNKLAPKCSEDQFDCLCQTFSFVSAYEKCCTQTCENDKEALTATQEIYDKCDSALKIEPREALDTSSANTSSTKSPSSSPTQPEPSSSHQSNSSSSLKSTSPSKNKSRCKAKKFKARANTLPALTCGQGFSCFEAKTTQNELHHLAPSCSPKDMDCLCRSHKWVCAYSSCAQDNCKELGQAQKAVDEIFAICGAQISSPNRLPSTDYLPGKSKPSTELTSKVKGCVSTCLAKQSKAKCSGPDNLQCVCKSHADVCAWAKCTEDECQHQPDAERLASEQVYDKCRGAIST